MTGDPVVQKIRRWILGEFTEFARRDEAFAAQCDVHLVKMPSTTRLAARRFHPVSEAAAELIAPAMDQLIRHDYAALKKQLLDVTQAQLEAGVPAHHATNDAGWKTLALMERFRFLHHAVLRDQLRNLTKPS